MIELLGSFLESLALVMGVCFAAGLLLGLERWIQSAADAKALCRSAPARNSRVSDEAEALSADPHPIRLSARLWGGLESAGRLAHLPLRIWMHRMETSWSRIALLICLILGFLGIPMIPWPEPAFAVTGIRSASAAEPGLGLAVSALALVVAAIALARRSPFPTMQDVFLVPAVSAAPSSARCTKDSGAVCWHMLAAALSLVAVSDTSAIEYAALVRLQQAHGMWSAFLWPTACLVWCVSCAPLLIGGAGTRPDADQDALARAVQRLLFAYVTVYAFFGGWSLWGLSDRPTFQAVTRASLATVCLQLKVGLLAWLVLTADRRFGRVPEPTRREIGELWRAGWRVSLPLILLTLLARGVLLIARPSASPLLHATIGWLLLTVALALAARSLASLTHSVPES